MCQKNESYLNPTPIPYRNILLAPTNNQHQLWNR
jgi:hypothetical protein